jgi:hypothetical protein
VTLLDWYVTNGRKIFSNTICLNIMCSVFSSLRYNTGHKGGVCLVSNTQFSRIYDWAEEAVHECEMLNVAICRVFRQLHHRNLVCSAKIYWGHSSRVCASKAVYKWGIDLLKLCWQAAGCSPLTGFYNPVQNSAVTHSSRVDMVRVSHCCPDAMTWSKM